MSKSRVLIPGLALLLALSLAPSGAQASQDGEVPLRGLVLGPDQQPLAGARVALLPVRNPHLARSHELAGAVELEPVAESEADERGAFRLLAPRAGLWWVRASAPGHAPRIHRLLAVVEETHLAPVELAPDSGLELSVLGPDGQPVAGALVAPSPMTGGGPASPAWSRLMVRAVTDEEGRARLPREGAERLRVVVAHPDFAPAELEGIAGSQATLRLESGVARPVAVRDGADRPVVGVFLTYGNSRLPLAQTGEEGQATVRTIAGQRQDIRLLSADGLEREATLEAAEGPEPRLRRLTLTPALRIDGRVVDLETRRPVPGALVWLPAQSHLVATTDGAGAFSLPALAGAARLSAIAPGYLSGGQATRAETGAHPVTLGLTAGARLAGTVVDEEGRPVVGVEVRATPDPTGRMGTIVMRGGPASLARSTSGGRFVLPLVPPGEPQLVRFSMEGFAPGRHEVAPLAAGERQELRLVLTRGRSATGRVVDVEDHPISGATITLVEQPAVPQPGMPRAGDSEPDAEGASDHEGSFTLPNLRPGRFQLTAAAPGFAPVTVPGIEIPEGHGRLDLGTVALAPGAAVEGVVVDPQGNPLPGVEIYTLEPSAFAFMRAFSRPEGDPAAVTAADGYFVLPDRRHGERLDLLARLSGWAPGHHSEVEAPTEQPLTLLLEPAARLSGRVVETRGRPVEGANVRLIAAGEGATVGFVSHVASTTSDQEGRFAIEEVPPGNLRLAASHSDFVGAELPGLEIAPGAELDGLELVLRPGATVTGVVTGPDGSPVAGARVGLAREAGPQQRVHFGGPGATSDGDGRFRLGGVEPGRRTLEAHHDRYPAARRTVELSGGEQRVDLVFPAGATVAGRVIDEQGAPVAGAGVMLSSRVPVTGRPPSATSGGDGDFRLEGIAGGSYVLVATREGYAQGRLELSLQEGEPSTGLEVVLARGGAISGELRGLDFDQLAEVRVTAGGAGGTQQGRVDFQGHYRVEGVTPGTWQVSARLASSGRQASGRVVLEEGLTEARLDLDFTGGATLSGRVHREGRPVSGVLISAQGADVMGFAQGRTGAAGTFTLEGLHEGRYRVEAFHAEWGLRHTEMATAPGEVEIELQDRRISGRVVEALSGAPIPGATVRGEPLDGADDGGLFPSRSSVSARTDSHGSFVLQGVTSGPWRLAGEKEGFSQAAVTVQVTGSSFEGVELALEPGDGLTLQVRLARGGHPGSVELALLDAAGSPALAGIYPVAEGGEVRIPSAPPGTWELLIAAHGSATLSLAVTVPGEGVSVVLEEGARIQLRVPDLAEEAALAHLVLTGADGRPFRSLTWGGQVRDRSRFAYGRTTVTGVPAGSWAATVTAGDGRTWSATVEAVPGAQVELVLE